LYSAVTHACLNRIRSRRTRERLGPHGSSATSRSQPLNAEEHFVLHSALRELPEQLAQVAVYFYMDELTHDEIARIIGCSRRQVGKLLEWISSHPAHKELSQCS
jgi:RNA polymerase sigma-70 factor (ECF subfamily)